MISYSLNNILFLQAAMEEVKNLFLNLYNLFMAILCKYLSVDG